MYTWPTIFRPETRLALYQTLSDHEPFHQEFRNVIIVPLIPYFVYVEEHGNQLFQHTCPSSLSYNHCKAFRILKQTQLQRNKSYNQNLTSGIYFSSNFNCIRGSKILVGRRKSQNIQGHRVVRRFKAKTKSHHVFLEFFLERGNKRTPRLSKYIPIHI